MFNENKAKESSPLYRDKEERRLITLQSMENLLKFHEVERSEKHNTLKFYAVFLGGGLSLVFGMSKFSFGIKSAILELIAITVILLINFLAIKKLLSVRNASNNIYHEYGKRMRFLLDSHSSDLTKKGVKELDYAFQKYIDQQKSGEFLPRHSSDTYEIYGFYWLNILFSFAYIIPIVDIYKYFNLFSSQQSVGIQLLNLSDYKIVLFYLVQFLFVSGTWWLGRYIINKHVELSPNMPNVANKPIKSDA